MSCRFLLVFDSTLTCLDLPRHLSDTELSCYIFYKLFWVEHRWPAVRRLKLLEVPQACERCYVIVWQDRRADHTMQLQLFDMRFRTLFCVMRWDDPHTSEVVEDIGPPFGPVRELSSPRTQETLQNPANPVAVVAEGPSHEAGLASVQMSPTQPHTSHSRVW